MTAPITLVVRIAHVMNLTPMEATVLPTYISVVAKKVSMSEWNFANELLSNKRLCDYCAGEIVKIAADNVDLIAEL